MRPILFQFGSLNVLSHGVFVGLGVLVALVVSVRLALRQRRMSHELIWIVAGGMAGAAIFARYGLAIRYLMEPGDATLSGLIDYGGRTLLGGLAGAYAGVVLMKRLIGYRRHTGDILVPGVALGIALGRVGCFLAERPGTPTSLPWGVRVPPDLASALPDCEGCLTGSAMHPSFLYESAFVGLFAWWLLRVSRSGRLPAPWMVEGDLFKLFLAAYAFFRFFIEFVRGNRVMALGLSGSQLMVLPAFAALMFYFMRRRGAGKRAAPAAT